MLVIEFCCSISSFRFYKLFFTKKTKELRWREKTFYKNKIIFCVSILMRKRRLKTQAGQVDGASKKSGPGEWKARYKIEK
jgi:hypothetical protein